MTTKLTRATGVTLGIFGAVVAVSFIAGSTLSADRTRGEMSIEWLKQKTTENSEGIGELRDTVSEVKTDVAWIRMTMEAEKKKGRRGARPPVDLPAPAADTPRGRASRRLQEPTRILVSS